MTKKELRALYLQKRLSLSESELADLNQKICNSFFKHIDLSNVKTLHTFLSLAKKREPNTWLMIDELKKSFPSIRISIPKINADGVMENYYFESLDQLKDGAFGILEPMNGQLTPSKDIDLVIVPLLVFDKQGHRVGYGKGHYDRFLKTCRPDCRKIGISLFTPEEKIGDTFEGDEPLNAVVTPEGKYKF
mgnify:CR=1 FL=1